MNGNYQEIITQAWDQSRHTLSRREILRQQERLIFNKSQNANKYIDIRQVRLLDIELIRHYMPNMTEEDRARAEWTIEELWRRM